MYADSQVWQESRDAAVPAVRVAGLASIFAPPAAGPAYDAGDASLPHAIERYTVVETRVEQLAGFVGPAAGGLLLLCLNLPWASVNGRLVWWWDLYRTGGGGTWAFLLTYVTLGAAAVCLLAPLLRGMTRAVTLLTITSLGVCLLLGAGVSSNVSGTGLLTFVAVVALTGLLGTSFARPDDPWAEPPRIMQGIFGGAAAFALALEALVWFTERGAALGPARRDDLRHRPLRRRVAHGRRRGHARPHRPPAQFLGGAEPRDVDLRPRWRLRSSRSASSPAPSAASRSTSTRRPTPRPSPSPRPPPPAA